MDAQICDDVGYVEFSCFAQNGEERLSYALDISYLTE